MRIKNSFIHLILIFMNFSCGYPTPVQDNKLSTSVSDKNVKGRIKLLNKKFSKDDLCKDYILANSLIKYLHNDSRNFPVKTELECPTEYSDFANMLKKDVNRLDDLHSTALVGYGLDSTSLPVVNNCQTDKDAESCTDIIGSVVYALPSPSEQAYYVAVYDVSKQIHFIRIEQISGKNINDISKEFKETLLYSHSKEGFSAIFIDAFLNRNSIDSRSKKPYDLTGFEVSTGKTMNLALSYDDKQTIFPYEQDTSIIKKLSVSRSYGCISLFPESNYDFGACIDNNNKTFIWLSSWPQREEKFIELFNRSVDWIYSKTKSNKLIFDLRGNMGGSPDTAIDLLCTVGDDNIQDKIGKMSLDVRYIPESFSFLNQSIQPTNINFAQNLSLKKILPGFIVKDDIDTPHLSYKTTFFEKTKLSEDSCRQLRNEKAKKWAWKILTNGREFSATEDFLFIVSENKKFNIVGKASIGGAGTPWWIELPKTKSSIRLSPARPTLLGKEVIEKIGIKPTQIINEWESIMEFETRIIEFEKSNKFYNPEESKPSKTLDNIMQNKYAKERI